jgi:hypothetical protein
LKDIFVISKVGIAFDPTKLHVWRYCWWGTFLKKNRSPRPDDNLRM